MEALTAGPNVLDIFGFCHYSVMVESSNNCQTLAHSAKKKSKSNLQKMMIDSSNGLSWSTRLDYVLQSARALKDLHVAGYSHNDIHTGQFILFDESKIKLSDFNMAKHRYEPWTWDEGESVSGIANEHGTNV